MTAATEQSQSPKDISLQDYPLIFEQVVAWGDMDAFGHVNNVQYYRYIESARIAYLSRIKMLATGLLSVVASNNCRYLQPVHYPDSLNIGVKVSELRQSGFRMDYAIFSTQQQTVVALAQAVVVMVDGQTFAKTALPDEVRQQIIDLEKKAGHDLTA